MTPYRPSLAGSGRPVLLAPSAGAGSDHPFMTGMRDRLVGAGLAVATFDYPYRRAGRRAPDRFATLLESHGDAYHAVAAAAGEPPVLVGKSMGGRIGSHLEVAAPGWGFLGYPLLPPGKTTPRDTGHLAARGPLLFVQGERDALAPLSLITALVATLPAARLEVIPGADHGFRVSARHGVSPEQMLDRLAALVAGWVGGLPRLSPR